MSATAAPRLTVVIPTHDRPRILTENLNRLVRHAAGLPIEVIVVHDGTPAAQVSADAAERVAAAAPWPLRVLSQGGFGPAPKRNRAVAEARAPACLLIGDDALPTANLVQRHLEFHQSHPEPTEALLGLVVPAAPLDASPYVRWLHEHGVWFGYASLRPGEEVGPWCFWTANVSAKRELMQRVGGFNEEFPVVVAEDIEFAFRLAHAGMRLYYDPEAVAEHFHPTDLGRTLVRMRDVGVAFRTLCELVPEMTRPTRPSARHRAKAAALTVAMVAGRPPPARRASWRFLCDEVIRESYWGMESPPEGPRIGRALTRLALADPLANPPLPEDPEPSPPVQPAAA